MTAAGAAARTSLTHRDWVDAAIEIMVDSSVEHVRVESLARDLGVSKGSFYWHFRNRDELLSAVLDRWLNEATIEITERIVRQQADAAARLLTFLRLPMRSRRAIKGADLELAILGWARRSRMAEEAVAAVDRLRLDNYRMAFEALGFSESEARSRAHLAYGFTRYISQRRDLPVAARLQIAAETHGALIERAGQKAAEAEASAAEHRQNRREP